MRMAICFGILVLTGLSLPLMADNDFCGVRNTAFWAGEVISYKVAYAAAGVNFSGGTLFSPRRWSDSMERTCTMSSGAGRPIASVTLFFG